MSRRGWITGILAMATIAFAIRFGLTFPWKRTLAVLAGSNWPLLAAACLINIVSLVAKAEAWRILLGRVGAVRRSTAQAATFVGAALSCVSVSVSGEAARAQLVNQRDDIPFGTIIASLVVTRIVEAAGLAVFLSIALVALPPWPWARYVGLGMAAVILTGFIGYRHLPWKRLEAGKRGATYTTILGMLNSSGRIGLAAAIVIATTSWFAQWLTYHWSIAATHTPVTAAVSLSALVVANVAGIPRLTPGNIGVMQGSIILGLKAFDISAVDGLAAGLALQAVQVIPILIIGLALVGRHGFSRFLRAPVKPLLRNTPP
ncbi:MAG: lysylphosphatidylglycerol synthase transmembrane domain-containing protein [Gemmatimonadota bacterium]